MSASDNLSNELFFTAHRGLTSSNVVDDGLGMHWSTDPHVARTFSKDMGKSHTVVTARIPMSSVETDTYRLKERSVLNNFTGKHEYPHEQEVPVKEGAPVHVEKIERPGNVARKKMLELGSQIDDAIEAGNPEKKDLVKINQQSNVWFDRSQKRERRRTIRFNPPKEMKA